MSDLGSTKWSGEVNVTSASTANVNLQVPVTESFSAAFKGTTPATNIETQNPGLENEVKTHEDQHVGQITTAANLPVTVTLSINGTQTSFTGTADQVIVNATAAFNGSSEAAGMTATQKGDVVNNTIATGAMTQMADHITSALSSPNVEVDATNRTNALLGSSAQYSKRAKPVVFNGHTLQNDEL